uniref:Electron transfer flavoprotein subunit beta n=1 Tax=Trypanosoma congolense (strain IL3000) TaxID=1068625 RepID=G0UZ08_TRYCI|nr:putative electron transfer flavoprotein [Trypanosoma congolense IL3000]
MFLRSPPVYFAGTVAKHIKVMIGVKRVVDYAVRVRVKDNKIQKESLKMSVNPFDEIAVEEAIRLKEQKIATEVTAVSIGNTKAGEALRVALAHGCDRAVHVVVPDDPNRDVEPLTVAKIFKKLHEEMKPDLWLLGKQAIDGDMGTTAQLLAGLLGVPQGTFASKIEVDDVSVRVAREVDVGHQLVELQMPCVLSVDLRLNTPRFPKLPNIMKARKKPIDTRDVSTMGINTDPHLAIEEVLEPPSRHGGVRVKTAEELHEKLRREAKVL